MSKNENKGLNEVQTENDQLTQMRAQYDEDRDLVNQLSGQAQALMAAGKFLTVGGLSKLQYIKENKLYRALKGTQGVDRYGQIIADRGTFDGFCKSLGLSKSSVDEDLQNLKAFGEEAMEGLSQIGVGYREMRQLRKLPESQMEQVKQLVALNDKDSLAEFVEDVVNQKAKLQEELDKVSDDAAKDAQAAENLLQKKDTELNARKTELEKRALQLETWDGMVAEIQSEIAFVSAQITEKVMVLDALREVVINADIPEAYRAKADEILGTTYYKACEQLDMDSSEVFDAANQLFGGYKDRPIPMLNDIDNKKV